MRARPVGELKSWQQKGPKSSTDLHVSQLTLEPHGVGAMCLAEQELNGMVQGCIAYLGAPQTWSFLAWLLVLHLGSSLILRREVYKRQFFLSSYSRLSKSLPAILRASLRVDSVLKASSANYRKDAGCNLQVLSTPSAPKVLL